MVVEDEVIVVVGVFAWLLRPRVTVGLFVRLFVGHYEVVVVVSGSGSAVVLRLKWRGVFEADRV